MNKNILIIEDEKPIIELIKVNLKARNYNVTVAKDGEEGLQKALSKLPNMIILDIRLPKLNGYEVCKQLKSNDKTKNIPIIFVSAVSQKDSIEKAKAIGGDYFIKKPFDITELIEIIEKWEIP